MKHLLLIILIISSFSQAHAEPECNKKPSQSEDTPVELGELRNTFKKWNYFVGTDACWIVTTSIQKRPDTLNPIPSCLRGTTLAMTYYADEQSLQISLNADFLIEKGIEVSLFIGDKDYPFFSEEDSAWPSSRDDELLIVNQFVQEETGVLEFFHSKMRQRNEIFSSAGFGEAYKELNSYCQFMKFAQN